MAEVTKSSIIEKNRKHANDTGSAEVQIALLTEHINRLTEHFDSHKKDYSSKRGLLKSVNKRRRFLEYLKHNDEEQYKALVGRLNLR
ncbi:MAG TPA: 30S ribosomal protein S15 [Candidatus Babeliales bacterium]|nr:30S ribosomal protein S15 [Candidatus Babeliales bacterium]